MLFFTRSLLCIGAVVALAEGVSPAGLWNTSTTALDTAKRSASAGLEDLCRSDPARCIAVAGAVIGAVGDSGDRGRVGAGLPVKVRRGGSARHLRPGVTSAEHEQVVR